MESALALVCPNILETHTQDAVQNVYLIQIAIAIKRALTTVAKILAQGRVALMQNAEQLIIPPLVFV